MFRSAFGLLLVSLTAIHAIAAEAPDLTKISRTIARQPSYTSETPLFGLVVLGPTAKTRVWAVLDKSVADGGQYDVLYLDRNANGDLTEAGERIMADSGGNFEIGSFTDPTTGHVHTDWSISRRSDGSVFLRMMYQGEHTIMGGYAEQSGPYCRFATSPERAPVLWPGTDGPFTFQRWIWKELPIGRAGNVRVFLGHRGHGRATFCAVRKDFLPPHLPVLATLIYNNTDGKKRRVLCNLRERCWGVLYQGPVWVPEDAAPGAAVIRFELPPASPHSFVPTDIAVQLVE